MTDMPMMVAQLRQNVWLNTDAIRARGGRVAVAELEFTVRDLAALRTALARLAADDQDCDDANRGDGNKPSVCHKKRQGDAGDDENRSLANSNFEIDLIIATDVVWMPSQIEPLVDTLRAICLASGSRYSASTATNEQRSFPHILLGYQERNDVITKELQDSLRAHGFAWAVVPAAQLHPHFQSSVVSIWEIRLERL